MSSTFAVAVLAAFIVVGLIKKRIQDEKRSKSINLLNRLQCAFAVSTETDSFG